ncbi:MAG TPA: hypothetical protein VHM19_02075 [Polyangiales bacterium]|nr:hypothetical protein [Polyangiales bacterium]
MSLPAAISCSSASNSGARAGSAISENASAAGWSGGAGSSGSTNPGSGGAGPDGIAGSTGGLPPGRATSGSTALPCAVDDILKTSCRSCHASMPLAGVPMALTSWEDTQAPSVSDPSVSVHDQMKKRLHDAEKPMPPTGVLAADTLAMLDAWLDGGAVAGTDPTCKPEPPAMMYGGDPPPDLESCYEVHAHAPGDKNAPLMVEGEHYATFYFDAMWPDGAQGVYFETLPGDHPEILHHWLIYSEENGNEQDGTVVYPASGTHPSAPTLIAGWAPGANNNDIPSNVGLQLSAANRKMSMEIHFFGQPGFPLPTTAGVKICTVEKHPRAHTATISWLGTELGINIPPMAQDATAIGTCTPQFSEDITILRSWPHMHLMGRKMESTIVRKDGTREMISPPGGWPFDFNSEVSHYTPVVVHPGDKIETICHYTNTGANWIQVGYENRYEMCFNFTLAYPAKALVNKGPATSTSLTNSSTACLF